MFESPLGRPGSNTRFRPWTYPSAPSSSRNDLTRGWTGWSPLISSTGAVVNTSPTRYTFPATCASAASGAARRPPVTAERNTLRFMASPGASSAPSLRAPGSPDRGRRARRALGGGSVPGGKWPSRPSAGRGAPSRRIPGIAAQTLPQACAWFLAALWAQGTSDMDQAPGVPNGVGARIPLAR
jgi:hypothetical protein